MQCVLLRMKSNEEYVHIRASNLLPLPSPTTIRRALGSSECNFSFNSLALEHRRNAFSRLQELERCSVLMFDEIQISKELNFDTRTLKWKGIFDHAGETTIMVPHGDAEHVLLIVFRPVLQSWIQPFTWFGTKGAAPGLAFMQLVAKFILCLFQSDAIVKAIVCDGASTNKSVMTNFGISGSEKGSSKTSHPIKEKEDIHWLTDVPHLIKSMRNHMHNHHRVQVN